MLTYLAVALMFVGLGFKVASAPFHVWTPDVYEGSPAPVVGFMSTGPKAAAFAVLLRVLFATGAPGWFWMVWVSAVLSMTIGNIGALVQNNVKRLLAYSSIAHAGYLLVAFAAAQTMGISAAMFYAASYAAMNVGAFAIVAHLSGKGEKYVTLEDYAGLGRRSPLIAALLTIFLLSLIGIPITGGFFAKFYVFSAALQSNLVGLTIIGVINSAIAAYYYLRIIVYMYMRDQRAVEAPVAPIPFSLAAGLVISLIAVIYLGVLPNHVLGLRHPRRAGPAEITRHSSSPAKTNALSEDRALICLPQPKLDDLGEDDNQREQHQGLDERQAENQRELNSRTGTRVARHAFAGSGAHFALAESGQAGGDRHAEARGNRDPVGGWCSGGSALRVRWHGHHHDGQQREHSNRQFPHCVSPYEMLPVGG